MIKYFLKAFDAVCYRDDINQRALSEKLGVKENVISYLRQGDRKLNVQAAWLQKLHKMGVSADYLLSGKGQVFKEKEDPISVQILTELRSLRKLNEQALAPLIDGYIEIKQVKGKENISKTTRN